MDALGRLLAVGSEWGSYAAPVSGSGARAGGSVARTALGKAAEEASEQLARQGVRQAARELPPVVIGENMERVKAYALMIGAKTINDFIPAPEWTLEKNIAWVRQMMRQGRRVIDIGPHFERRWRYVMGLPGGRPPSDVYALERRLLKGYANYEKLFIRGGRYGGGVPGLHIKGWAPELFFHS